MIALVFGFTLNYSQLLRINKETDSATNLTQDMKGAYSGTLILKVKGPKEKRSEWLFGI